MQRTNKNILKDSNRIIMNNKIQIETEPHKPKLMFLRLDCLKYDEEFEENTYKCMPR